MYTGREIICLFNIYVCLILSLLMITAIQGSTRKVTIVTPPSISKYSFRITGGSETTIERYPFMVQVFYGTRFYCGGSLITAEHVLTAAHCILTRVAGATSGGMRVVVGSSLITDASGGQTRYISKIAVHPRYNSPVHHDNDVAVLRLERPVAVNNRSRPAPLPPAGWRLPDDAPLTLLGWGVLYSGSKAPSAVLRHVVVLSISRRKCNELYRLYPGQADPITENMFCGGILDGGGKDACQSDSGGPAVVAGVVVGVTSWGAGCADALHPGVSARVSRYTGWIQRVVEDRGVSMKQCTALAPLIALLIIRF